MAQYAAPDPHIDVHVSPSGRVAVISLSGELDLANATQLRERLLPRCDTSPLVVLDLTDLVFLDSTIIGVFVAAMKRSRAQGGKLIAVNASGIVLKALQLTGVAPTLDLPADDGLERELQEMLHAPSYEPDAHSARPGLR